jgi:DNA-binding ferritin-like protein
MLQASRMVQADMRLLSGLIVETGGFRYCRMGEVEHRSYLPLLLGETFEMESSLRRLTRAEERLANMLEHTRGLASREGDKSTEDAVVQLLKSSKFRICELARTKTVKK